MSTANVPGPPAPKAKPPSRRELAREKRALEEKKKHELAIQRQRKRMRRADMEFLPAALEILETPASPVRLWLMFLIIALATAALAWSYIGRVDIVAIAQGKVQAVGRTKVIQPLETGKIKTLNVENGRHVRAGEVLVRLDPSVTEAEEATLSATLHAYEAEVLRRHAAIGVVSKRQLVPPKIAWGKDIPATIAQREQRVLENDLGQLSATIESLNAVVRDKTAEQARLQATVASEERLVAVLEERVKMRSTLLEKSAGSKASVIDAREGLETQRTYLANLRGQAAETAAAVDVARRDIEKSYRTFLAENSQKLADAERQAEDARRRLEKARIMTSHTVLASPIAGVVQGLTITTVGQVVQTGEQIMEIVPQDKGLEVECYLPNQDIGFVKPGQAAVVKFDAFPFTRYGTIDATVMRVAKDAIPQPEASQREENPNRQSSQSAFGGAQRTQNLVFPVTLKLAKSDMEVDGRPVPLVPGMAATAEVKTGSRRILEYIFSPITEVASGALKER